MTENANQEDILYVQRNLPTKITGKNFLFCICLIVIILAVLQIALNLLIAFTGIGLLNTLYYILSAVVILYFMGMTVYESRCILKKGEIVFVRLIGDSTTSVVSIPLKSVNAVYPVHCGENLKLYAKEITVLDRHSQVPWRMRIAFAASYVSAGFARFIAGKTINNYRGFAVSFTENGKKKLFVFTPDEEMLDVMEEHLGSEVFGRDDREKGNTTIRGRVLQRAFPELYQNVEPLVRPEEIEKAKEEIARQKANRKPLFSSFSEKVKHIKVFGTAKKKENGHKTGKHSFGAGKKAGKKAGGAPKK